MKLRNAWGVVLAMIVGPSSAFAFYDLPVIDPANPIAGEPIGFSVRSGVCDFVIAPPLAGVADRELVVVGNVIKATVRAADGNGFVDFCIYPTVTQHFPIGALPAGTYRLELYRRNVTDPNDIRLATTVGFTVSPIAVPALDSIGAPILTVLLASFGFAAARSRRGVL